MSAESVTWCQTKKLRYVYNLFEISTPDTVVIEAARQYRAACLPEQKFESYADRNAHHPGVSQILCAENSSKLGSSDQQSACIFKKVGSSHLRRQTPETKVHETRNLRSRFLFREISPPFAPVDDKRGVGKVVDVKLNGESSYSNSGGLGGSIPPLKHIRIWMQ